MTGEISLRGLVLPVSGIKEKVIAAAQAGIKRVILPARNKRDFDDVPEEVRKQLEFVWMIAWMRPYLRLSVQRTVITRPKRHNLPWFRDRGSVSNSPE
jgi:ATP-dependent Lon protease